MGKLKIEGRLSFEHVFRPDSSNGGNPAYSATVLIPQGDPQVKMIQDAIEEVAKAKWRDKATIILKGLISEGKTCLRNGDNKSYAGYAGMMYLTSRNSVRPTTYDAKVNPVAEEDGIIYSGCYVRVCVELWAQDNANGKRVNGKLLGVQFMRDGDRFGAGSGPATAEDFSVVEEEPETKAPWD